MANINLKLNRNLFNDCYYNLMFDYEKRYEIYYGGAGSGKSVALAMKLIIKACRYKRKILVIRKYGTTLKDSVFQLIVDTLKKWQLYSYCKINLSTFTIILPNSSMFLFKGMDDSEKIKSITDITDIWCEEATELSEDEYTQLDLRLRAREPYLQLYCSFNPVSKQNFVFKRWFADGAVYDKENTLIIRTTYKDNKFLPRSYIEALEQKIHTNPTYYKIYALGEFASLEKLVYNNWRVEEFNHRDIKGELICGLDYGYVNDISAFTASIVQEEQKKLYIFAEWGDTNKTNEEIAAIIASMGFAKANIIADSSEQKSIEEMRRKGITRIKGCSKGKDSILHGIQQLQNYEIIVHPSCIGVITEFENYSWQKDRNGEYTNTPIDFHNHYMDSIRYSLQALKTNKLKTISKSMLSI